MPVHKPTTIPSYSSSSIFAAEGDVSSSKVGSSGDGDVSGFESYAEKITYKCHLSRVASFKM